jgi:Dienelactone hydrolase family
MLSRQAPAADRYRVVVLPDNRGLYSFYEQLTVRLAEQGHVAIAIDYFGRTAGTEVRAQDFPFMKHLMQLTRQGLDYDIETAAKFLRSTEGGSCTSLSPSASALAEDKHSLHQLRVSVLRESSASMALLRTIRMGLRDRRNELTNWPLQSLASLAVPITAFRPLMSQPSITR